MGGVELLWLCPWLARSLGHQIRIDDCSIDILGAEHTHRVNPMVLGCHSDTGYAHQPRGLLAELIYGSAFEKVPDPPFKTQSAVTLNSWLAIGSAELDLHDEEPLILGSTPLLLRQHGDGAVNRGFANEGLYLKGDKEYKGFVVMKSSSAAVVHVALQSLSGIGLAIANLSLVSTGWTKLDFDMVPSHSAECEGIGSADAKAQGIPCPLNTTYDPKARMSDRRAHTCVRCGGQFVLTLLSGSDVRVGFVSLQPGSWGTFAGLPVRSDAAKAIKQMGVKVIRQGGSFASQHMDWRNWRGPLWKRPSAVNGNWGHGMMSGWGMFEMIDFAEALGITPIITLSRDMDMNAYADLVEYCWGNESTEWGSHRIRDGHAAPYNVTHFELGNEQPNLRFVEQVRIMEDRAKGVGKLGEFHYYLSNGWEGMFPNVTLMEQARNLGLGDRLSWDVHVNDPKKGWRSAISLVDEFLSNSSYSTWGVMNLETNYGDHTVRRMLQEALDLNMFLSYPNSRLQGRTASFCMESSGYNEGGLNDQGLVFFLPNMTWLQPPGYVHAMVSSSWQPVARHSSRSGNCTGLESGIVSVQASEDGHIQVMRLVNTLPRDRLVRIDIGQAAELSMTTIASRDLYGVNTAAHPLEIKPSPFQPVQQDIIIPAYSFSIIVAKTYLQERFV